MKTEILIGMVLICLLLVGCNSEPNLEEHKEFCKNISGVIDARMGVIYCNINNIKYEVRGKENTLSLIECQKDIFGLGC